MAGRKKQAKAAAPAARRRRSNRDHFGCCRGLDGKPLKWQVMVESSEGPQGKDVRVYHLADEAVRRQLGERFAVYPAPLPDAWHVALWGPPEETGPVVGVVIDRAAEKGDVLPALARLLRRMRDNPPPGPDRSDGAAQLGEGDGPRAAS